MWCAPKWADKRKAGGYQTHGNQTLHYNRAGEINRRKMIDQIPVDQGR
jgi:hypothetical protein